MLYPAIRFFLEFLRLDPSPVAGININQTSMLVVLILSALLLVLRHTLWANGLQVREQKIADEVVAEIEAGKLASSELEIEVEHAEQAAEETEEQVEVAEEKVEGVESEVDQAIDKIAPQADSLPETEQKLEDDISSFPND